VLELRFPVGTQDEHAQRLGRLSSRIEVLPDRVLLYTEDADGAMSEVSAMGLEPVSTVSRRSTLEDVFLNLTGRTLVD
jgi:lipooligosaccharide transport system ATP-binding protein